MFFVYKYLAKDGTVLYVGQTIDLDRRFNEHKGRQWDLEKEKIVFGKCKTLSDMNLYEMYYINKLQAKYNTALVFNDLPSFELPELEWIEYDKNYHKKVKAKLESDFRKRLNDKFGPDFWLNKIEKLKEEFDNTNDFEEKKNILIEIRKCEDKINKD